MYRGDRSTIAARRRLPEQEHGLNHHQHQQGEAGGRHQARLNPLGPKWGEPVDLGTGLMIVDKTDLMVAGRLPAVLRRSYNSPAPEFQWTPYWGT